MRTIPPISCPYRRPIDKKKNELLLDGSYHKFLNYVHIATHVLRMSSSYYFTDIDNIVIICYNII